MKDTLHDLTLADVLRAHATSRPAELGAVCGGYRLDFVALDRRVNQLANALAARGIGAGDRLLWLGQNCHRLLEGLLAAAKLGAVFCPANWRQSAAEFVFVITDSDPAVVFFQEAEIGDVLRQARADSGSTALWIGHDIDGDDGYEAFLAAAGEHDPAADTDEGASVLMMYTAAFTGSPNGALLSNRALVLQGSFIAQIQGVGADYVYLDCGPLFHVATFMTTLATFLAGGANVFTPRVDAEELCRLIAEEHCTGGFIMPPTMDQIVELNADGRYDLSSLRGFPGKPEWTAMITVDDSPWGRRPAGYGQTEVMGLATFNALQPSIARAAARRRSCASPRSTPTAPRRRRGDRGARADGDERVLTRPTSTKRQAGATTWAASRPRRSLTFIGPARLVKSAAENIYPSEVEGCLRSHPAVADAAVIGVPDRTWGQNVTAVVVLREGITATASPEDIIEHCRERIASYKKPKRVEFTDVLPRNGFAIDYDALDASYGGGGYSGDRRSLTVEAP